MKKVVLQPQVTKKKGSGAMILLIIIVLLIIFGIVYFNTNTGKAFLQGRKGVYQDNIDKTFTTNSVSLWKPTQNGILKGVAINGEASGEGIVKTYLVHGKYMYLLMELELKNETITFNQVCNETCNLKGSTEPKYLLRVEVPEFTTLKISSITYGLGQNLNQSQAIIEKVPLETPDELEE